jgi:hypothetical protein
LINYLPDGWKMKTNSEERERMGMSEGWLLGKALPEEWKVRS